MNVRSEQVNRNEATAHRIRREYISKGRRVSLIAYDPARDAYVFDVL